MDPHARRKLLWLLRAASLTIILTACSAPALSNWSQVTPTAAPTPDANTTLSLSFENSLSGAAGEAPSSFANVSYQTGVQGQGVLIGTGSQITYPSPNNINSLEGTIEFWIKPNWNGNDNQTHTVLDWNAGAVGGMLIHKNAGNSFAVTMDRYAAWRTVSATAGNWLAGQWHHIALTYSNSAKEMKLFVDGSMVYGATFSGNLPVIGAPSFTLGTFGGAEYLNGVLDEFVISDRVRSADEISAHFLSGVVVNDMTIRALTLKLWPTWKVPVTVTANTNFGTLNLPPNALSWSSSNSAVATINAEGQLTALAPGTAIVTGLLNGTQRQLQVFVNSPARPPSVTVPAGFRAMPATGYLFEMPVVSLRYIPTADGVNVDTNWAPGYWGPEPKTVSQLEQDLDNYDEIRKYMLEEGSRYHGYGSQSPPPSLGYRIIATITVYEPQPPGRVFENYTAGPSYHPEWLQIFDRLNIRDYIENQGAKEIWFYASQLGPNMPSYNPASHPPENFRGTWETNMASPTSGDISNSDRNGTDLPVYGGTYIVWHQWIRRLDTLTLHNDSHQWEQMLMYVNQRQDGNNHLFWRKFAGYNSSNQFQRGRAGWTHYAPNSTSDYDYNNFDPFSSDIRDWRPQGGGQMIEYSAATARDTPYIFPNNYLPTPRIEPHWYVYWRQSMPGRGNNVTFDTSVLQNFADQETRADDGSNDVCVADGLSTRVAKPSFHEPSYEASRGTFVPAYAARMTNWWLFAGDWDAANRAGLGLYEPVGCSYPLSVNDITLPPAGGSASISVTSTAGCKWFASSNAKWASITAGDTGNGAGTVNLTAAANAGESRVTTLVVAGQPVTVRQGSTAGPVQVTVSGQVFTSDGRSLRNASVTLTNSMGDKRSVLTSSLGYYTFDGVWTMQTYTVRASSKRYRFNPQTIDVNAAMSGIDFTGIE